MDDVTEEVSDADITLHIDTKSPHIPHSILQLGLGCEALHQHSKLRVTNVEVDYEEHPPLFCIEGVIMPE